MGNSNIKLPEPSDNPRHFKGDCCRLDVCYILDNEERIKMMDCTRNVLDRFHDDFHTTSVI